MILTRSSLLLSRVAAFFHQPAVAVVVLLLALFLLEAALRWTNPGYVHGESAPLFVMRDAVGYGFRSNTTSWVSTGEQRVLVSTDSRGHRYNPSFPLSTRPECRVLVVGDSFVAGFAVRDEQLLTHHLARALAARGSGCRVVNAGVPGYDPGQYYQVVRTAIGRSSWTHVLIFMYLGNDLSRRVFVWRPRGMGVSPLLVESGFRSRVYENIRSSYRFAIARSATATVFGGLGLELGLRVRASILGVDHLFSPSDLTDHHLAPVTAVLAHVRRMVRRAGSTSTVVLLPPDIVVSDRRWAAYTSGLAVSVSRWYPGARVATVLRSAGVSVVDTTDALIRADRSGSNMYGRRDRHLSPAGHRVVAAYVASLLGRLLAPVD